MSVLLLVLAMMIFSKASLPRGRYSEHSSSGSTCSSNSFKDVVFVIDASTSIREDRFQLITNFTANITDVLINNSNRSAVGVILFSDSANIGFILQAHTNSSALRSAFRELPYLRGGTDTAEALTLLLSTAQDGKLGLRNCSSKIAIVITDGRSTDMSATSAAAAELHSSNISDVYAVGVGRADQTELRTIASSPDFVFFTNDFNSDGLQQLADAILPQLCAGAVVSLSQSQYSVGENDTLSPNISLSGKISEDVIVEVTISDGSANAGVDYAMSTTLVFNVTISAGSTSSSFSIDIINNMIQEDNETFNIAIRLLPSCLSLSLGTSSSTVMIIDDDVALITFTSSTFSGLESFGVISANITISGGIVCSKDINIPITFTEGNASADDFDGTMQNVTIVAGANIGTVNIPVTNDKIVEGDEIFTTSLSVPSSLGPEISTGTVTSATLTIIDTTLAVINFTSAIFNGSESDGNLLVCIMINNGVTSSRNISVNITFVEGSATGNKTDFDSVAQTVTIIAGTNTTTVNIPLQNDSLPERDEMFNISLTVSSSFGSRIRIDNMTIAVAVIMDASQISGLCSNQWKPLEMKEVTNCSTYNYSKIKKLMIEICKADLLNELITALEKLTDALVMLTKPKEDNTPACPTDLMNIVLLLEFIINTTESYPGILSSEKIIQDTTDIFSNILSPLNKPGWTKLQEINPSFNQRVLLLSERFGLILAENLDEDRFITSDNLLISTKLVTSSSADVSFNGSGIGLKNSISIPAEFIQERSNITGITSIPIVTIQYRNIQDILPITDNSTHSVQPVSEVLSSQVTNISDTSSKSAVMLTLQHSLASNDSRIPRCGFWNFSLNEGSGGWDTRGVQIITNNRNNSIITCNSSHLTSFAVLVDVSGGHEDFSDHERRALSIISYIGCGISLICLLIAIILLIYYRKTIFKELQNFVHLNLAFALSLALVVFVSGIETATDKDIACKIVAAMLHYFFTAVFTWMLCEGILLYILLVRVFNIGLGQKKWLYLALGWGIPVPIVAISTGISYDHYGNDDFCWISTDEGAIWGFVAPMIAIIIVNAIFLALALYSLYKSERRRMKIEEITHAQTIKNLLRISIILLPLLGITWVFGILAVNQESSVFAWIFAILNSLQGMFILIFQVLRNEKLRQKFISFWKKTEKYDTSNSSSKQRHIITRNKTSSTTLSGFNEIEQIPNDGTTNITFKVDNAGENGSLSKPSENDVKESQYLSNNLAVNNKKESITSFEALDSIV